MTDPALVDLPPLAQWDAARSFLASEIAIAHTADGVHGFYRRYADLVRRTASYLDPAREPDENLVAAMPPILATFRAAATLSDVRATPLGPLKAATAGRLSAALNRRLRPPDVAGGRLSLHVESVPVAAVAVYRNRSNSTGFTLLGRLLLTDLRRPATVLALERAAVAWGLPPDPQLVTAAMSATVLGTLVGGD